MEDNKNGTVRDFVAVGDVEIKVIGGEAPILDSETPVRQILEQLVAKRAAALFAGAELEHHRADEYPAGGSADLGTVGAAADGGACHAEDLSDLSCAGRAGQPGGDRVGRHQLAGYHAGGAGGALPGAGGKVSGGCVPK